MLTVKKVKIKNFKRFKNLDIEIRTFDCIVGSNNSGKTTLLQALALFDFCIHHCLSSSNGDIELKRRTISQEELYVIPVANLADLWTNRQTGANSKGNPIQITLAFEREREVTASVVIKYNRFALYVKSSDSSQDWLRQLRHLRISYLPVFSTFLTQEERRTPAVIKDYLARGQVNVVIRNLLLDLKQEGREGQLVAILQHIFPELSELNINFDEDNDLYIATTYKEKGRKKEFDIFSAGSGFHQLIYLFGFILLRQPTTILLDEPDVHLHGNLQRALIEELRRLVAAGKQVLLATHSRDAIAQMNPENILTLEEDKPKRLVVAFDVYDTLDRLGSIEPTQLPIIQAYRRILVVENKTDWNLLSVFASRKLGLSTWQQVEQRLAICYSQGNPWKQPIPRLRKQLQQAIAIEGRPLEMFVVADRDYHPDLESLQKSLSSERLQWHIWGRVEIENYLLSIDGIVRLVAQSQVNADEEGLRAESEAALRAEFTRLVDSSRDSANDRLVKAFEEYGKKQRKGWDASACSRKAREYLQQHWETEKLSLADAKEIVLPGLKLWLQKEGLGQFSDKALAEELSPEDLPTEIDDLARRLASFAGVAIA